MMDKQKLNRLKQHAQNMNYTIDEEMTLLLQNLVNDSTITLRLPNELKQKLKSKAAAHGIKYQKYLRMLIINDLKNI